MRRETAELLGRTIGHIRLTDVLGEGGMGAVYAGFDDKLQRKVAVKAIRAEFRLDPATKARFLREARILSNLNHPEICTVHEFIEGDSCDFLVLELVPGHSLGEAIKRGLTREQQLEIAAQLLEVLVAVHARGVIHRDLKPENVMITPTGRVKVLDFGLARSLSEQPGSMIGDTIAMPSYDESSRVETSSTAEIDIAATMQGLTQPPRGDSPPASGSASGSDGNGGLRTTVGTLIGTLGYMSPEQARGEPATAASDMYSLGLILQELFTGQPAFDRSVGRQAMLKRAQRGMSEPVAGLEPDLTALVERLKAFEPASRPSSVDAAERLAWIGNAPRRRRNRRLKVAAWIVLACFATAMAIQSYRLSQARKREQLASRFGAEVERIDSLMRVAHMAPLHPLSDDVARVRDRMAQIREGMRGRGAWGTAMGRYAIGRGHLALAEYEEAREALEAAWDGGYTQAETAYALGLTLGYLYQDGLRSLRSIADPEQRAAERRRLENELRDPAVHYLRRSQGLDTEAPEYVEGLLALYEGRPQAARELAVRCRDAAPWFFECHLLEGEAWFVEALRMRERGDGDDALAAFTRADSSFGAAVEIAESDPRGHAGSCGVWANVVQMRLYDLGGDLQQTADRALASCNRALTIDPRQEDVLEEKIACFRILAEDRLRAEADPSDALEKAKASARQLIDIAPEKARSHHLSAIASMFSAMYRLRTGRDAGADIADALESQKRAAVLDPNDSGIQLDLGNAYHWHGRILIQQGENPGESFAAGAAAFRRAIELKPSYAEAYNNLASLDLDLAETALGDGGDPREAIDEALAMCDKALELKPDHMYSVANRGIAYLFLGRYQAAQGLDPRQSLVAAETSLEAAVALNADHPSNYYYLAETMFERASYQQQQKLPYAASVRAGVAAADDALRRAPGFPEALIVRDKLRQLTAAR